MEKIGSFKANQKKTARFIANQMIELISETTDRLDKFIASKVAVSRVRVQKAIKEGKVMVEGIIILAPDYDVIVGNKITLPEFEGDELKPSELKLKIVFENDDLAVIDKPAGMVVHPGAGNKRSEEHTSELQSPDHL